MLGRGDEAVGRRKVVSLEAARLGRRHLSRNPGVLARALDDASPARVARHVQHRREGQSDAILRRLLGRGARRFLPKLRIKQAGFRERDGENRVVAVNDVEPQEQGNAEARILHREALDGAHLFGAPEIEQTADPPGS